MFGFAETRTRAREPAGLGCELRACHTRVDNGKYVMLTPFGEMTHRVRNAEARTVDFVFGAPGGEAPCHA
jgi:hypothetical protein